jgi:hypothetical protein
MIRTRPRDGVFRVVAALGWILLLLTGCAGADATGTDATTVAALDQRYCSEVEAWRTATMLQFARSNEDQARELGSIQERVATLAPMYEEHDWSKKADAMASVADRMGDYRAALVEPFAPRVDLALLTVEQAMRNTGVRCPTP